MTGWATAHCPTWGSPWCCPARLIYPVTLKLLAATFVQTMLQVFMIYLQTINQRHPSQMPCRRVLLVSVDCTNAEIRTWMGNPWRRWGTGTYELYILAASCLKYFRSKHLCQYIVFTASRFTDIGLMRSLFPGNPRAFPQKACFVAFIPYSIDVQHNFLSTPNVRPASFVWS